MRLFLKAIYISTIAGILYASCKTTQQSAPAEQSKVKSSDGNSFPAQEEEAGIKTASPDINFANDSWDDDRGSRAEYDPGPKKDSFWVPLFGSVPNYRKIGKDYTGEEKFRWNIGPMWYRGRLGQNQVKVLVVGQEGAQDENTSNRTFTGGTGTKTQNMLAALGMDRSYLFLNTFVYTIFGQRDLEDPDYMAMEQGLDSPIVKYRHQLFDYAVQNNPSSLSMLVSVGGGGRDSLVTWINARTGGAGCPGGNINACDLVTNQLRIYKQELGDGNSSGVPSGYESVVPGIRYSNQLVDVANNMLVLHMAHPGMARFEGGLELVRASFQRAAGKITKFMENNPSWLASGTRPDFGDLNDIRARLDDFEYQDTPVAHGDFAFATTDRLGSGGTNTTRDGQDAIVIWSSEDEYGSRGNFDSIWDNASGTSTPSINDRNGGFPWEPQRWDPTNPGLAKSFDYGPCGYTLPGQTCRIAELLSVGWGLTGSDRAYDLDPPNQHWSYGVGASYRGNPRNASLIILADQHSHDDFFTARALTGAMGQKLQTWLYENGYNNSDNDPANDYVIVRTLPVYIEGIVEGSSFDSVKSFLSADSVKNNRDALIAEIKSLSSQNGISPIAVKTMGPFAQRVVNEIHGGALGGFSGWEDITSQVSSKSMTDIDRGDLPYSTRYFMGTTGTRSATEDGRLFRFQAPYWVVSSDIPN